jgi:hypothetical protein
MSTNPYESPRPGEPLKERPPVSDPIQQLLTEIRDTQYEMLELTRDALNRQNKRMRYSYVFMAVALVAAFLPFSYLMQRARVSPPVMPARAFPAVRPSPAPGGASLDRASTDLPTAP